ncbi:MAG: ATP-binding protein [Caldilineaceae bacterium]
MSRLVFVQMSGAPGAGKTTVADAIAKEIGAVIIDHDITKSALLEADIPATDAGRASYMVLHALARHLLQQEQSVIFDSPCFYEDLLKRGQQLAEEFGARYCYVECRLDDLQELDRRLQSRVRKPSQLAGVFAQPTVGSGKEKTGEAYFRHAIENMKRPASDYLVVDTSQPLEFYLEQILDYVKGTRPGSIS